jgi:hypothetical protein
MQEQTERSVADYILSLNDRLDEVEKILAGKGVPKEALYRLLTPEGEPTLTRVIDLVIADWRVAQPEPVEQDQTELLQPELISDEVQFVVPVVYTMPRLEKLRKRFPLVHPFFICTFEPAEACKTVKRTARTITLEYVHMSDDASTAEALDAIEKNGYRPALPEELIAFDVKFPRELLRHPIVALGSEILVNRRRYVACLQKQSTCHRLNLIDICQTDWTPDNRFLVVRRKNDKA